MILGGLQETYDYMYYNKRDDVQQTLPLRLQERDQKSQSRTKQRSDLLF